MPRSASELTYYLKVIKITYASFGITYVSFDTRIQNHYLYINHTMFKKLLRPTHHTYKLKL